MLIVGTGCSPAESGDDSPAPSDEQATGEVGTASEMDPNFDAGSLPDDFPTDLMPNSFTGGMYVEVGGVRNVSFESTTSFDEVVAEYTGQLGEEPVIVQGEERLASWTVGIWAVSVFEGPPTLIGVSTTG